MIVERGLVDSREKATKLIMAGDVKQPAVEEHRREHRDRGVRKRVRNAARSGQAARNRAELEDELFGGLRRAGLPTASEGELIEEDEHVQDDDADGDEREARARDVVLERDHSRGRRMTLVGRTR